MTERSLPYDNAAERGVLGSILLDREAILVVSDILKPEDFYLEKHGWVYEAMVACLIARTPPDLTTVASELRRQERLELMGGLAFLGDLLSEVPTAVHVEYYAKAVAEAAVRRRLITVGGEITVLGYDEADTLEATLDAAEQKIYAISQRQRGQDFLPLSAVAQEYFDDAQGDDDGVMAPTGLTDLDELFRGGLRGGQFAILAARPSMGKSGLAMTIAYNLGFVQGRSVGVVSLEMSRQELLERLVAIHTGMSTQDVGPRMRRGDSRVVTALGEIGEAHIAIEDSAGLTVMDVRSKCRRLAAVRPLDLVIIDYLQLLESLEVKKSQNRNEEVSVISRALKRLARELNCPVLALSQLSRAVEQRQSHIPVLSDLRESGSLEQDADIVMFIYREDAYAEKGDPKTGSADIYLAKHRNGPVGVATLRFDAPTTRFKDLPARQR